MTRFKSPFTISNSHLLFDMEEHIKNMEAMTKAYHHRQKLEKIEKEIYKPIYRLDSYKSMPLDTPPPSPTSSPPYHKPSIGLLFCNRIKPKLQFNSMVNVHIYHT